jgi:hypothetical protein
MSSDDVSVKMDRLHLHDPQHWLGRAEEARAIADSMLDACTRSTMLDIAEGYERMAEHARTRRQRSDAGT